MCVHIYYSTIIREYFVVRIYFRIAWLMRKLNAQKHIRTISINAVQDHLSENYLT